MRIRTAGRGLVLALLALPGPLLFTAYTLAPFVSMLGIPALGERIVGWCRGAIDLTRRLSGDWCEAPVESSYLPPPSEPQPDAEGWYRHDRMVYRTPRVPRYLRRVEWVSEDPATGQDLSWLLLNTVVGPVLGLLAVIGGQPVLRLYGRWTRSRLGVVEPRGWQLWVNGGLRALWQFALLVPLAVLNLVCGVLVVVLFVLAHVLGLHLWWPWCNALAQRLAGLGRRLAGKWSGIPVGELYQPLVEPVPTADGLYRAGRELKSSPRAALHRARYRRAMTDPATGRDLLWLLGDGPVTALLLAPLAVLGWVFLWGLWIPFWVWVGRFFAEFGSPWEQVWAPAKWLADTPLLGMPLGLLAGAGALALAPLLLRLHGRWTKLLLAPTESAELAQRVRRLAETRADATEAEDTRLRRIERDLHDGPQARLVALGLKLSAAEQLVDRDPVRAKELLGETKADSGLALAELRALVRGIRPPVLTERGLVDAVRAVALDLVVPIEVEADVPGRCPSAVETAAYFATLELITNAIKHSGAESIRVELRYAEPVLRVVVTDDGRGGASPESGGGLTGILRRIGTFDGTLQLTSPPGGPTAATMEIPCALS
ncbi:sensor histidine kinase [Saccharopolyspora kobensis]|uniref:sensor histidine kinase n=1 Tax=Saccharopolyspora kobensis TaxID=146035 RepID=UPI000B80DECF|nr:sensor histidine kinase [Saccharopolyspora kobensis]